MHLLIACAGSGRRMGAQRNKLLLEVAGRPVLAWTLDAALAAEAISWIGIVGQSLDQPDIQALVDAACPQKPVVWVEGGDTRQDSVCNGLAALPAEAQAVLIHDGARCLVDPALINRCAAAVLAGASVIAAAPVTDTIKRVDGRGVIQDTPDRSQLWGAQTPQGFPVEQLRQAHAQARREGWSVTDDASLFERLGWEVEVMESSPANIKITTPFDLTIAAAVLAARPA